MKPKVFLTYSQLLLCCLLGALCVYVIAANAPATATATVQAAVVPQGHYVRQCGPAGCRLVWVPNVVQATTVNPAVVPSLDNPMEPPCNSPDGVCDPAPSSTAAAPAAVVPAPRTPIRNAVQNYRVRRFFRRWRR
jgi:hypothetical protein